MLGEREKAALRLVPEEARQIAIGARGEVSEPPGSTPIEYVYGCEGRLFA
jgi:hypothetical protein